MLRSCRRAPDTNALKQAMSFWWSGVSTHGYVRYLHEAGGPQKGAGHDPESRASAQGPCLRREGAAYADLAQAHSTTNHQEAARAGSRACALTKMTAPDASAVAALLREFGQRSALR